MSKELSSFSLVPNQSAIWSAQKGNLRCTALKLRDGSLCLYSPVLGLGSDAKASLASLGTVSVLLAPNHYHHKGLNEYVEAFPDAKLICSERAQPRLAKQTGLAFDFLPSLQPLLPGSYRIVEPDGLKTGEVWLVVKTTSESLWIVCDSFAGHTEKVGSISSRVTLLRTFPTYGIEDRGAYAAWVQAQMTEEAPSMILPCHGSIVQNTELPADIATLLEL